MRMTFTFTVAQGKYVNMPVERANRDSCDGNSSTSPSVTINEKFAVEISMNDLDLDI